MQKGLGWWAIASVSILQRSRWLADSVSRQAVSKKAEREASRVDLEDPAMETLTLL